MGRPDDAKHSENRRLGGRPKLGRPDDARIAQSAIAARDGVPGSSGASGLHGGLLGRSRRCARKAIVRDPWTRCRS